MHASTKSDIMLALSYDRFRSIRLPLDDQDLKIMQEHREAVKQWEATDLAEKMTAQSNEVSPQFKLQEYLLTPHIRCLIMLDRILRFRL